MHSTSLLDLKLWKNACTLFDEQANLFPDNVAIKIEDNSLTYRELKNQSEKIAFKLTSLTLEKNSVIGLCTKNHEHTVAGALGILKAGYVYLPIDPNYPEGRIKAIIENSNPAIVLTEPEIAFLFADSKILSFDDALKAESIPFKALSCNADDLAYIVYTSGSTGKPKGIGISHEGLMQSAMGHRIYYPKKLVSLHCGSISFDASILTIFHTLLEGGTICFPDQESEYDPQKICSIIQKNSVNFFLCIPSFYGMLLEKKQSFPSLEWVSLGGESLSQNFVTSHIKCAPQAILYNEYGPSEYAVAATLAKIYDPQEKRTYPITIGKPLPNTSVYILDEYFNPVPPGTKGELFISGSGLAKGYINNPTLTAEKFLWLNLDGKRPVRVYRTGDFAKMLPDGNIDFLGRIDHQVKIRGHRIELGEIEWAISQHSDVKEIAVIVEEINPNSKKLLAFFSTDSKVFIERSLRAHLSKLLPRYMIPNAFIQIENFKRTPNGKIDRKWLLEIAELKTCSKNAKTALSPLEETLLNIWKKVLANSCITVNDNFFHLGGDSIQIATVQTLIDNVLNINVPVTDLFRYPTISTLAKHLSAKEKEEEIEELILTHLETDQMDKKFAALNHYQKINARRT